MVTLFLRYRCYIAPPHCRPSPGRFAMVMKNHCRPSPIADLPRYHFNRYRFYLYIFILIVAILLVFYITQYTCYTFFLLNVKYCMHNLLLWFKTLYFYIFENENPELYKNGGRSAMFQTFRGKVCNTTPVIWRFRLISSIISIVTCNRWFSYSIPGHDIYCLMHHIRLMCVSW